MVVFVLDVTDDFLDEIFERHDAADVTELIDDNREVLPILAHFPE